MILETGNKYSIYNDGDFYYLEVHHVSSSDEGFYNCLASNAHGMAVVTCQIEVVQPRPGSSLSAAARRKESRAPTFIEVLPGKLEVLS